MILQALAGYYKRISKLSKDSISEEGYSPEKISYEIVISKSGDVVQINNICDTTSKKPKPKTISVPHTGGRTSGIKPNFLWDKSSYVLGVSATSKRAVDEHNSFKDYHLKTLDKHEDPGLRALCEFLKKWNPDQFKSPLFSNEILDKNLVFRLDGETDLYLHERPAAKASRRSLPSQQGEQNAKADNSMCLISGERCSPARLHSVIKGVRGAQSSGACLVSFNKESFTSYGKEQGSNAPVSESSAFAYTTALNHLLRSGNDNRQRLSVGDSTIVFWAEEADSSQKDAAEAAEDLLGLVLESAPSDDQSIGTARNVIELLRQGRALTEINAALNPSTKIFVLGLAPNASRLSVRFWHADRLDGLLSNLIQHANDIRIDPPLEKPNPSAYQLVLATAPHRPGRKPRIDDAFNIMAGDIVRSILSGRLYPRSLLSNLIMRMRSDGQVNGYRVSLCKGVLTRERRLLQRSDMEEIPVSLDKKSVQPGYLLGRLFAVLEYVQKSALGSNINATIRDRYYGAASATPASVFPVLLRSASNHLSKVRREKPGYAVNLEKLLQEIVSALPDHFPRSLNIEDQGRFAIGYYHQSRSHYIKKHTNESTEEAQLQDE